MLLTTIVSCLVLLKSCQGQSLDEAFRSTLQSELTRTEKRLKDHMTTLISGLGEKISDGMCASRLSKLEDKLVVVLDEIRRMKEVGNPKTNWGVSDDDGWYLAFRGTAGVGSSVYDAYTGRAPKVNIEPSCQKINGSEPCSGHYRNDAILDNWQNIKQVALALYNKGDLKQSLIFDAVGTDFMSWFSKAKLVDPGNWTDLGSGKTNINYFSMTGDFREYLVRRFLINRSYGGCPKDFGWFVVLDSINKPCDWEKGYPPFPNFLYSTNPGAAHWLPHTSHAARVASADVMAIFVKSF